MKWLVAGMGVSGSEVAAFLARRGWPFDTFDEKLDDQGVVQKLGHQGFRHFREAAKPNLSDYHALIVSPGFRNEHPLFDRARTQGLAILPEIEFAFHQIKGSVVAVTGSNGKSTTASLIEHLLRRHGLKTSLCGNIGSAFIAHADDDPERVYVVEVSSFQLEHTRDFCPKVGILLNISADHLDRHGSLLAYEQAKFRLFENQGPSHVAVIPPGYAHRIGGKARVVEVPGPRASRQNDCLVVGENFKLRMEHIPLLGAHNLTNALFACVVADSFGMNDEAVARAFTRFQGLPHRMERVGRVDGRLWINDSKATNVHATQAAIDAMETPYCLILGGQPKGDRFTALNFADHPPRALIAYGEAAPLILEDLSEMNPVAVHAFADACWEAHGRARDGDAVLLSPACASYDQFDGFQERGDAFKTVFKEMGART